MPPTGPRLFITVPFTPHGNDQHTAWAVITGRVPRSLARIAGLALRPFFRLALVQDLRVLREQQRNKARFGEQDYAYTELDLLRPHIDRLLRDGTASDWERTVELDL